MNTLGSLENPATETYWTVFGSEAWEGWDGRGKRKLVGCGMLQEARGVNHGKHGKVKAYGWLQRQATWTG